MTAEILSGKVFLVVTGASQGIGQKIAVALGHEFEKGSQVLLLARNVERLKSTAESFPKYLKVTYESVDLSVAETDELDGILRKHLRADDVKKFNSAIIVHNVGNVGDLHKKTTEMTDFDELRKYYHLNVFSSIVLNAIFMKIFNDDTQVKRLVVNLTSLCSSQPIMRRGGFYGPGKAAREMFFKVFAVQFPQVNVLNYSPGTVDTKMYNDFLVTNPDAEDCATFGAVRTNNELLAPEQSAERLVIVLKKQKYKSGDYVDYFDDQYV